MTIVRLDDRRLQRGARVLFDRDTEREALHGARLMKRLKPEFQKYVRFCAEAFLEEQLREPTAPDPNIKPETVAATFTAMARIAARVKSMPLEERIDLARQLEAELADETMNSSDRDGA